MGHYTQNIGKIEVLISFLGKKIFEIGERFRTFQVKTCQETCLHVHNCYSWWRNKVLNFEDFPYIWDFGSMIGSWTSENFELHKNFKNFSLRILNFFIKNFLIKNCLTKNF